MPQSARLLIADDDEHALSFTRQVLVEAGYECDSAQDGHEAAKMLKQNAYDLFVSDIEMPGNKDLALIRQLPDLAPGLGVLLLTAFPSIQTATESLRLPVVAYLSKPFVREELLAHVKEAVEKNRVFRTVCASQSRYQALEQQLQEVKRALATSRTDPDVPLGAYVTLTLENIAASILELKKYSEAIGKNNSSAQYAEAILEAIQVLEKTKKSFKSKDLGDLRQRLERILQAPD